MTPPPTSTSTSTSTYCQTCSSLLPPVLLTKSFLPPCCLTPICHNCIARNPRLKGYLPCLRCGDVRTAEGSRRVAGGARAREVREMREEGEVMFDVDFDAPTPLDSAPSGNGLDEVDCLDNDNLEGNGGYPDSDRPPSYRAISPPPSSSPRVRVGGTDAGAGQPKQSAGPAGPGAPDGMEKPDDETELVEIKHSIVRSDTLISIARKYAADPHDLLTLNSLPPTTLLSNPRLLHTRKTLVISRRRIPRSRLQDPTISSGAVGASGEGKGEQAAEEEEDTEERRKRAEERAIKRFQLVTKTVDPGVGRAYLALVREGSGLAVSGRDGGGGGEGEEEGRHPLELGSGEMISDDKTSFWGTGPIASAGGKAVNGHMVGGGGIPSKNEKGQDQEKAKGERATRTLSKEDRALESFFEDDEWERASGLTGPGKRREGRRVIVQGWGIGASVGVGVSGVGSVKG